MTRTMLDHNSPLEFNDGNGVCACLTCLVGKEKKRSKCACRLMLCMLVVCKSAPWMSHAEASVISDGLLGDSCVGLEARMLAVM